MRHERKRLNENRGIKNAEEKEKYVSETLDRESGRSEREERTQTNPPCFYPRFPVGFF